jgi:hypothetical protein
VLNNYDAHPVGSPQSVQWTARVRLAKSGGATVYARDHSFPIDQPLSFKPKGDPSPSALDQFLGAIAGEIVTGFHLQAKKEGRIVDACEAKISCWLENPLVAAKVVGETGSPAIAEVHLTLYVATPEDESVIQAALQTALDFLPIYQTITRNTTVQIQLQITL